MHLITRHTHSQRLENWLGAEAVARVSSAMLGVTPEYRFHGRKPIPVMGVPGRVYATRDGDFIGAIEAGRDTSAYDRADTLASNYLRAQRLKAAHRRRQSGAVSLDNLISARWNAGGRKFTFSKVGPTGVANVTSTLWRVGTQPAAGAVGAAAPGGTVHDDSNTGAFLFSNPSGGQVQRFITGWPVGSVAGNNLLLCDRLFSVAKTMNSTATEAVTGVPTRYQSNTLNAEDSAENNFLTIEVGGTALAATAHNWTTCLYQDQSGNTGITLPSVTGNSGAIVDRLDQPASTWFCPLATGDSGIESLSQMQCSAAVATGVISFVISHPIAWMPCEVASKVCIADQVVSAFDQERIFDDACLYFLEVTKPTTGACTYTGSFLTMALTP
jgi:hypothetical protein